jgi:phosphoglycerate dehydrogenase-like enzyme
MRLRCTIIDDYQGAALTIADWSSLADKVEVRALREHYTGEDALAAHLADCEVVVIMRERTPFGASLLGKLPKLRLLITSGMRNQAIDLTAAAARGVVVCGTASLSTPPVELTWALILGLARHITTESASLRANGPWQQTIGLDLCGRTLGLLGLGKIGARVAQIGQAFGMKVQAWSQNLTPERAAEVGVTRCPSLDALLATSDVVSIHLVLSPRTAGIVGAPELARLQPTALLINTARAALVDQEALIQALEGRQIAGAGLDVFDQEPLPPEHPLRRLPNVLATPHLGYVSEANYLTYFREAIEDIHAFLAGAPIRTLSPPLR